MLYNHYCINSSYLNDISSTSRKNLKKKKKKPHFNLIHAFSLKYNLPYYV